MKNFKILEHKADIKIKVFGKTMEELYKNAVFAMTSILFKNLELRPLADKKSLKKILITKSLDREILLVDFLNDILGESQINQAIYPEVRLIDFQPEGVQGMAYLKAEIGGYPIERFDEDIKAVTYHDLSIRENSRKDKKGSRKFANWEATILFDV
jgi:SHS2 domain-containing protein